MAALSCTVHGRAPNQKPASAAYLLAGRRLRIIATNDFHGALEARRDGSGTLRGGAATLAAEIRKARDECQSPSCVSILLDGGDEFQGTAASNFVFGRPVVELFNRLGVAAGALGNHEFDWGVDSLRARMRDAHYAILGANVQDSTGADIVWIRDDTIVEVGGVHIGIVGVATVATPTTTRRSSVAGLRFVDPASVVDAHARSLRARGANAVVVVAHAGAFCNQTPAPSCEGEIIDLAQRVTERVDAIVSGHTHSPVTTVVRGIPIVQARSSGTALGVIDLALDRSVPPVVALRDVLPGSTAPDRVVDSLVHSWTASLSARVSRPIARIGERMTVGIAGTLGNLIADAQRAAGKGDVAVMNTGGVRAAIDTGMATYGSLFEVQPFGNVLTRVTVRGRDLRPYLERVVSRPRPNAFLSGVTLTVDTARASGTRVVEVRTSDGKLLDDDRMYRVVLSDFLATGGDDLGISREQGALSLETLDIVDLDALIAFLETSPSPVRPPRDERVVIRSP